MRVPTLPTLVAVAACVLCAAPAPASAAEKGLMPDLTWGIRDSDFAPTQAAITDLGAKWVRLEFRWYEGEPSNNSYSATTLAKWDRAVATSVAAGAKVIAMVHRAPSWASGVSSTYGPPRNPADFADLMQFLANRYKGQVSAWEIWNEQNGSRFWPTGPNAGAYVNLLKAGHGAVKAADPNALVVFGGLVQNDYAFVEAAYAAGAKGYFDIMNVHPYPGPHPPEQVWYDGSRVGIGAFTGYREVRSSMLANGDDKPIWFTEFGWSTTTTESWGVTPEQQADYLRRAYCVLEQDPYVGVAVWYNLRNNHWDNDADRWETQLGLMKTTFERKPSYAAYKSYDPAACPAPPAPEPVPEPPPAPEPMPEPPPGPELPPVPEPTLPADPAPAPEPTPIDGTPAQPAEPAGESEPPAEESEASSIRSRTSIVLRRDLIARSADRRRRARRVIVYGRVRGADRGRVQLRVRRVLSDDGRPRARVAKAIALKDGRFRLSLRFRRDAKWRVRVVYVGNSKAYPARSRFLRFRT